MPFIAMENTFTPTDTAVIRPAAGKEPASIGRCCVLAAHPADLNLLVQKTGLAPGLSRSLFNSRIHYGPHDPPDFSLAGPFIGSPYAVMLLETVIAWGVSEVIFFGWCGAVSDDVHIGDVFLPTSAMIDEGTSRHYLSHDAGIVYPDAGIQARIRSGLIKRRLGFNEGPVWSTDAIFRETTENTAFFRNQGAQVVEMECSALFSVGTFRRVPVGCVLAVSDDISSGRWHPGFRAQRFKTARNAVIDVIRDFLTGSLSNREPSS